MKKVIISVVIIDLTFIILAIILYGPWDYVRNIYVTTSMQTMNHKWLAKIFYNDKEIKKIMKKNYIVPINENVNTNEIKFDNSVIYKSSYEKQVLMKKHKNDLYKLITTKVGKAKGYIVIIYAPTKISLIRTKKFVADDKGERVIDLCKRYKGTVCINGGGFENGLMDNSSIPQGYVIDNGKIVWQNNNKGNIIGFTQDGKLKLMSNVSGEEAIAAGIRQGMEFGPFLIINGQASKIEGTPYGIANKCAIAQRKDGIVLFLVTEGKTYANGATLKDVIKTLKKYGAHNAANLDGGQSASLVINNKLINTPNYLAKKNGGRNVVTGWGVIP